MDAGGLGRLHPRNDTAFPCVESLHLATGTQDRRLFDLNSNTLVCAVPTLGKSCGTLQSVVPVRSARASDSVRKTGATRKRLTHRCLSAGKSFAMCWSEEVSLASWVYDMACLAVLLARRRRNDLKYVVILSGLASQEIFQFLAWRLIQHDTYQRCNFPLAVASLGAMLSSQAFPLGILAASEIRREDDVQPNRWQQLVALGLWSTQLAAVFVCILRSGIWCIRIGRYSHQRWICAQSLYAVGGFPLYCASFGLYVASILYGLRTLDLPKHETAALKLIGAVSAVIIYGLYTATLEACSIWCWSAASLSTYAIFRARLHGDKAAKLCNNTPLV